MNISYEDIVLLICASILCAIIPTIVTYYSIRYMVTNAETGYDDKQDISVSKQNGNYKSRIIP